MDVVVWLRSLGLGKYEAAFRENEIDETVLPSLTAEDLKDLGVSIVSERCEGPAGGVGSARTAGFLDMRRAFRTPLASGLTDVGCPNRLGMGAGLPRNIYIDRRKALGIQPSRLAHCS